MCADNLFTAEAQRTRRYAEKKFQLRHNPAKAQSPVNAVNNLGYLCKSLSSRIEPSIRRELFDPLNRHQPGPLPLRIFRTAQRLRSRALEAFGSEAIERTIHVAQRCTAFSAVESDFDVCVAAYLQVPTTIEINHCVVRSLDSCDRVILNLLAAFVH